MQKCLEFQVVFLQFVVNDFVFKAALMKELDPDEKPEGWFMP